MNNQMEQVEKQETLYLEYRKSQKEKGRLSVAT